MPNLTMGFSVDTEIYPWIRSSSISVSRYTKGLPLGIEIG